MEQQIQPGDRVVLRPPIYGLAEHRPRHVGLPLLADLADYTCTSILLPTESCVTDMANRGELLIMAVLAGERMLIVRVII